MGGIFIYALIFADTVQSGPMPCALPAHNLRWHLCDSIHTMQNRDVLGVSTSLLYLWIRVMEANLEGNVFVADFSALGKLFGSALRTLVVAGLLAVAAAA